MSDITSQENISPDRIKYHQNIYPKEQSLIKVDEDDHAVNLSPVKQKSSVEREEDVNDDQTYQTLTINENSAKHSIQQSAVESRKASAKLMNVDIDISSQGKPAKSSAKPTKQPKPKKQS